MSFTLQIAHADKLVQQIQNLPNLIQGGVKVDGESAAYSLVWEWGSARLAAIGKDPPGPKTLWSTNPNGEMTVLTLTAPHGFIRINTERYREILRERYKDADLPNTPIKQWESKIKKLLQGASAICAGVIADAAPIDSGDLRSQIEPVAPDDPILISGTENVWGPTDLNLGTDWL